MPQTSAPEATLHGTKRARRPKAAAACDSCRTRKVKCDGELPCSSCTQSSFECSYRDRHPNIIRTHTRPDDGSSSSSLGPPIQLRPSTLPGASARRFRRELRPASLSHKGVTLPEAFSRGSERVSRVSIRENTAHAEENSAGLGAVNWHTGGSEFYGPSGTFYFLAKLRSHANSGYPPSSQQHARRDANAEDSVVNLLHSSDYTTPPATTRSGAQGSAAGGGDRAAGRERGSIAASGPGQGLRADEIETHLEADIQRECVRLYFENLHCVHPVLHRASFLASCEKNVWFGGAETATTPITKLKREKKRFLALFYTVLAIGSVVAGETSLLTEDRTIKFLQAQGAGDASDGVPPYPPIRVALLYFEKAKAHLDDVFESTSFETAETLFLMPHACYMYAGMALRTALAIGIPTDKRAASEQERLLWWALYSFEIEMSSSSGRQPFVQSPEYYGISLPSSTVPGSTAASFVNCMVELARILADVAANTNQFDKESPIMDKSQRATELETRLENWKSNLPAALDFKTASLTESEPVIKQKTVLKLRFLNFRVLIHRPFLLSNTAEPNSMLTRHVLSCVESARELIRYVYETYLYRPYFRTWWYNCTYVLDASMVLLYVVLTNTCPLPVEVILGDIDKSLEIFAAMKALTVARRCTEIIREVLNAAKQAHVEAALRAGEGTSGVGATVSQPQPAAVPLQLGSPSGLDNVVVPEESLMAFGGEGLSYEELYASLVDTNLVYNFLNFEDWNTWPGAGDVGGQEPGSRLTL